jgi:glycerophosphoryl diester phosphodiesterase
VAPRSRVVYIELKCETKDAYAALAAAAVAAVRRHGIEGRAVIKCFQHAALREVRRLAPEIRTAALFERSLARPFISAGAIVGAALACGAEEVSLHHSLLRRAIVRAAQARGLRTLVWTVDTSAALRRVCDAGASVVFTNRPALMRAAVEALPAGAADEMP